MERNRFFEENALCTEASELKKKICSETSEIISCKKHGFVTRTWLLLATVGETLCTGARRAMNHYLSMIFGCFIRKRRDLSLLFPQLRAPATRLESSSVPVPSSPIPSSLCCEDDEHECWKDSGAELVSVGRGHASHQLTPPCAARLQISLSQFTFPRVSSIPALCWGRECP